MRRLKGEIASFVRHRLPLSDVIEGLWVMHYRLGAKI
jgi:hypothetical protein